MVPGIVTGVVVSILILLYKAAYPHIAELGKVKGHQEFRNVKRFKDLEVWENFLIARLDAPLTFINIQYFKEFIETRVIDNPGIEKVIIDFSPVSHLDASASDGLLELLQLLKEKNIGLVITDVIGPVRDILFKTGIINQIGKENIYLNIQTALENLTSDSGTRYEEIALQYNK
jgi:SulP family sulfate permease